MCSQQFRTFTLPGLLPEGHVLIVNQKAFFFDHYVVSWLSDQVHGLMSQQVFTEQEVYALLVLLEAYPHYASYEALLAALSDRTVDQAREVVHQALEGHNLDRTLNPLRNLLATGAGPGCMTLESISAAGEVSGTSSNVSMIGYERVESVIRSY